MKKRIISVLLALCMLVGLAPALTPQAQAFDLLSIFDAAGSIVRGSMNAAEQAKQGNWNFGQAFVGTFKSIGKELLGMDDDAPGTTVVVNQVDLSEVELELKNIQGTLKSQSLTLSQIKQDMNSNMQTISAQLSNLSSQIDDKTKQQQYYTYLTNYFSFYNEFYEAVSYYDQALSTLYSSNPTQNNIKNTFDQFYELKNVSYTGNFYSAIDRLGKYLRGEYMSTDPGSVVDILCEYYTLAGYSETQTATAVKEFVAQTFYTYCLANYYYLSVALFQDTYIDANHLDNYTTDFGMVLNAAQIEQLAKSALNNFAGTTSCVFRDLNRHFCSVENLPVSYVGPAGVVSRNMNDSKMDVEPGSSLTMPDTKQLMDVYLGEGYSDMFGGMCTYTYACSDSAVKVDGNTLSFAGLTDGQAVEVQINCTVADVSQSLHTYTFTGKNGKMAGGYGTMEYPYVMTTTDHFKAFASGSYTENCFVSLNADLDFNKESIDPVMWNFKGIFYGNGHTVSNFKINYGAQSGTTKNFGLFSTVSGTVADLTVKNAEVQPFESGSTYCVGVIAGALTGGKLLRCEAVDSSAAYAADSSGTGYVGGLAGLVDKGTITGCISRNVTATLGYNNTAGSVGGLVGFMKNNSTMTYSGREEGWIWQNENTNTSNTAGGLVGTVWSSKMDHCWSYKTSASYTDKFYSSCNFGSLVGRCSSLNSNRLYIYNGENASTTNLGYPELGYLEAGWSLDVNLKSDFTCSNLGIYEGYLTNTSGSGNPICLVKPMSIELNTSEVKTDYAYGEPLALNGLGVTLKRGSEYITAKLVPYTVETNYNAEKPGTYTVSISTSCGSASFKVTVAEKPHVFKQVLTPATCTTEGSVVYRCQDAGCTATFGEVQTLPALGHTMTHYDGDSVTCGETGTREYWHCTVCQKYFLDADGSQEISEKDLVIAGGHTFGQPEYVWTKTENGVYTCTASVACTNENCPDYPASNPMTEVGTVDWQIKDVPTCSKPAYAVLTATFTKSPFTTQTKQVEVTASSCPSAAFSDAPDASNWAHDGIDFCISKKLMEGFPDGTFQPDNELTRAQMVTILYREAGSPDVEVTDRFSDVSADQWFAKAVCWAAENEVVNGYTDGTFLPDNPIKRQEVAAMLYRLEGSPAVDSSNLTSFPDYNTLQDWAKPALSWAVSVGLITGVGHDGLSYLRPIDPATRAQFATIIMRYLTEAK